MAIGNAVQFTRPEFLEVKGNVEKILKSVEGLLERVERLEAHLGVRDEKGREGGTKEGGSA